MEIKICGITNPQEAEYLNEADVDYAGFVFYEKSKRSISLEKAREVFRFLNPEIKKVAVTVSPTIELVQEIQFFGFDIVQVHKTISQDVMENCHIPIWYAFNIADSAQLEERQKFISALPNHLQEKITAIVVDGAEYGSGKTFDWSKGTDLPDIFSNRKFVLAGGLNVQNVGEGIRIFEPDIVDVSSGVEGKAGKEKKLVLQFAQAVRRQKSD